MANVTSTCVCSHAGLHHRGRCRIPRCPCPGFKQSYIRRGVDASWLQHAHHNHRRKGNGPS